jgi:hypothetical protein
VGIFPTDIPLDESGLNQDRWHFQLSEPYNGHHVGALLENGRTVEPVMGRILRRISGGMGSMLVGAVRVEGGTYLELGDCSTLRTGPTAEEIAAEAARVEEERIAAESAERDRLAAEVVASERLEADAKAKADADELAKLEAELKALETAETEAPDASSTPAAVPAPEFPASRDDGAAVPSAAAKPKDKGKK